MPFVCGWKYFPNNKGLVSGIISGAYGMGNVIFSYPSTAIVNPHGLEATIEINADTVYFTEDGRRHMPPDHPYFNKLKRKVLERFCKLTEFCLKEKYDGFGLEID